jgi:N-methylhydantoinase B
MPLAEEIYQEGLRIPPVKVMANGKINRDVWDMVLANVRTPEEREGDLAAMLGANNTGERRLMEIVSKYGAAQVNLYVSEILDYSERMTRYAISQIPDGTYEGEDFLDNDGITEKPVAIRVQIQIRGDRAIIDFSKSDPQAEGSVNAVYAITASVVFYVFRTLVGISIPSNAGGMRPLEIVAPEGTIVNARPPAAVCGGNVETSQRIVDVIYKCLARAVPDKIPAASQGTMNNLTFGAVDPRTAQRVAYYETVSGGMGARPTMNGLSGVHTHMTNSLNTPVEALEHAYPIRLVRYALRKGSGGSGKWRGGDGVVREIQFLTKAQLTLLTDRRKFAPYGLNGGSPGAVGRNFLVRKNGTQEELPSKCTTWVAKGEILSIQTPGGGGWGTVES